MPTKLKGMTSLEIAIIVAIILIIAIAVGWYLYTTFVASTSAQGRLAVSSAEFSNSTQKLTLFVSNPGPQPVTIQSVVLSGTTCTDIDPTTLKIGNQTSVTATCSIGTVTPGTMLPGYVVTTAGSTFPFNAIVRP